MTLQMTVGHASLQATAASVERSWRRTTVGFVTCGTTTARTRSITARIAICAAKGRGLAWIRATACSATRACTWLTSRGTAAGSSIHVPSARRTCTRARSHTGCVFGRGPVVQRCSTSRHPCRLDTDCAAVFDAGAATVWAFHALALLQAAHAGVLHVSPVPQVLGRHDGVLSGMTAVPIGCFCTLVAGMCA